MYQIISNITNVVESRVSRHMHALVLPDETDVRHQSALRLV